MSYYEALLACWLSDQVSEASWAEHLKDDVFRGWLSKRGYRF